MDGSAPLPKPAAPSTASRRVVSAPPAYQPAAIETLFVQRDAKIVSFDATVMHRSPGLAADCHPDGALPSSSHLERTIAVGLLRIYRAPGSVAFLTCGSALRPILPKSQCWCIDENSTRFVLQIRRPSFWRIELNPYDKDHHKNVTVLREVLGEILQFEKTPCPFQRGFTVELPEPPALPVKKIPWTPKSVPKGNIMTRDVYSGDMGNNTAADIGSEKQHPTDPTHVTASSPAKSNLGASILETPSRADHGDYTNTGLQSSTGAPRVAPLVDEIHGRISRHAAVGAGIHQNTHRSPSRTASFSRHNKHRGDTNMRVPLPETNTSHRSLSCSKPDVVEWTEPSKSLRWVPSENCSSGEEDDAHRASSRSSSRTSFRSAESQQPLYAETQPRIECSSSDTGSVGDFKDAYEEAVPGSNMSMKPDLLLDRSKEAQRHRHAIPNAQGKLPMILIEKTYNALLAPPAHLIALILKVAARLSIGKGDGEIYGYDDGGEQIRVQWEYSEDDLSD